MRKSSVLFMILAVLACLMVSGCVQNSGYKSIEDGVPTISVQGMGKIEASPDEAITRFGVVSEERSLAKAYKSNTGKMNAVIATVKSAGIEEKDIKTSSYTVAPVYPIDEKGRQIPGKPPVSFRVKQQLTVKIRDLSKVGAVIDKVIASGTNIFYGINFSLSNVEEVQKEAKMKAARDAKEKASSLARNLGVGVGRVLRVSETSARPYLARENAMSLKAASFDAAPQIQPGSMEISATCNVVYEVTQ